MNLPVHKDILAFLQVCLDEVGGRLEMCLDVLACIVSHGYHHVFEWLWKAGVKASCDLDYALNLMHLEHPVVLSATDIADV